MGELTDIGVGHSPERQQSFEDELTQAQGDISSFGVLVTTKTGYDYAFEFVGDHPAGQFIRIHSEPAISFMRKGSFGSAVGDLTKVAQHMRLLCGGQFIVERNCSPIIGLSGNQNGALNPRQIEDPMSHLSLNLHLRDAAVPDIEMLPEVERQTMIGHVALTRLNIVNMQSLDGDEVNRDWASAFSRFNHPKLFGQQIATEPIDMCPKMVAQVLLELQEKQIVQDVML